MIKKYIELRRRVLQAKNDGLAFILNVLKMTIGWVTQKEGRKVTFSKYAEVDSESKVRASSFNMYAGSLKLHRQLCCSNILQII